MLARLILAAALLTTQGIAQPADNRFVPDDLAKLATVAEPALRATATSFTPESLRFSACARPWDP